jgi:hypothetical protein
MAQRTYDETFVEELVADVDAYLLRLTALTNFAESQVEQRVLLARQLDAIIVERDALRTRVQQLERHPLMRLSRLPRRVWRLVRHRRWR